MARLFHALFALFAVLTLAAAPAVAASAARACAEGAAMPGMAPMHADKGKNAPCQTPLKACSSICVAAASPIDVPVALIIPVRIAASSLLAKAAAFAPVAGARPDVLHRPPRSIV